MSAVIKFLRTIRAVLWSFLGIRKGAGFQEDIAAITEKIESIKIQYGKALEEHKQQNQLKFAALDRRLEVAQEAFSTWWGLFTGLYSDQLEQRIQECQAFWVENCLYLSEEASFAYRAAYQAAGDHKYLKEAAALDSSTIGDVQSNFRRIKDAGEVIARSVAMPAWTDVNSMEPRNAERA